MKKVILLTVLVLSVIALTVSMVACTPSDKTTVITKITGEVASGVTFKVGDEFSASSFVYTATLSDDTTSTLISTSVGLVFDKSNLKLVDNKFTEAGDYDVKAVYLNKYETVISITVTE
ncbi:MAG: hypothetical protein LBE09_06040 [Christensenellaceae bacterium]|jgi:hypothetical protein|nr:hypothetical protein [Christensenellaceae bacterium]